MEIERLDNEITRINYKNFFREVIDDIIDKVRPSTPPLPNMESPDVFAKQFEEKNKKYGLWFGSYEMHAFKELIREAHARLGTNPEDYYWDGSIDQIYELIWKVQADIPRNNLMLTFNRLVSYSKKVPAERSLCYGELREAVLSICSTVPSLDESFREEMGMMDYVFEYVTDETPDEELHKMKEDREARKAEWLKKNKKKPKSEEEEAQDLEELKRKISEGVKKKVVEDDSVVGRVEDRIEMKSLRKILDGHIVMNTEKWDELYRKKSILDIGCEGKNILLRLDLDVPLTEYIPPEEGSIIEKETRVGAKIAKEGLGTSTYRSDNNPKSVVNQSTKRSGAGADPSKANVGKYIIRKNTFRLLIII